MTQEQILEIAEQNIDRISKETTFENKHYSYIYWMIEDEELIACPVSDNERLQDESDVIFRTKIPYETDYIYEGSIDYDEDDQMIASDDLLEFHKEDLETIVDLQTGEILDSCEFENFLYDQFWKEEENTFYLEQIKTWITDNQ